MRYVPGESITNPLEREKDCERAFERVLKGLRGRDLTEISLTTRESTNPDEPTEKRIFHKFISPPQPKATLSPETVGGSRDPETGLQHKYTEQFASYDPRLVRQYVEVVFVSGTEGLSVTTSVTDGGGNETAPEYPIYAAIGAALIEEPSLVQAS